MTGVFHQFSLIFCICGSATFGILVLASVEDVSRNVKRHITSNMFRFVREIWRSGAEVWIEN